MTGEKWRDAWYAAQIQMIGMRHRYEDHVFGAAFGGLAVGLLIGWWFL